MPKSIADHLPEMTRRAFACRTEQANPNILWITCEDGRNHNICASCLHDPIDPVRQYAVG